MSRLLCGLLFSLSIVTSLSGNTTRTADMKAQGAICSFVGDYKGEDGNNNSITFNGLFFIRGGGTKYYADIDATIHDPLEGVTATFEDNSNVIHWSNGGTWIRL